VWDPTSVAGTCEAIPVGSCTVADLDLATNNLTAPNGESQVDDQASLTIACAANFQPVSGKPLSIDCSNGAWDPTSVVGTCEAIPATSCTVADLDLGTNNLTAGDVISVPDTEKLTVECDTGFEPADDASLEVTCAAGTWSRDTADMEGTCVAVVPSDKCSIQESKLTLANQVKASGVAVTDGMIMKADGESFSVTCRSGSSMKSGTKASDMKYTCEKTTVDGADVFTFSPSAPPAWCVRDDSSNANAVGLSLAAIGSLLLLQ